MVHIRDLIAVGLLCIATLLLTVQLLTGHHVDRASVTEVAKVKDQGLNH
jgi:hypothetical protein